MRDDRRGADRVNPESCGIEDEAEIERFGTVILVRFCDNYSYTGHARLFVGGRSPTAPRLSPIQGTFIAGVR